MLTNVVHIDSSHLSAQSSLSLDFLTLSHGNLLCCQEMRSIDLCSWVHFLFFHVFWLHGHSNNRRGNFKLHKVSIKRQEKTSCDHKQGSLVCVAVFRINFILSFFHYNSLASKCWNTWMVSSVNEFLICQSRTFIERYPLSCRLFTSLPEYLILLL